MDHFEPITKDVIYGYAFFKIMSIYSAFISSKTKELYDIIMPPDWRAHVIPIFSVKVGENIFFNRPEVNQINISCSKMKYCRINEKMVTAFINDKGEIIEVIEHNNICDMFNFLIDLTKPLPPKEEENKVIEPIPLIKKKGKVVKKKKKKEVIPGLFV